jgi:hypothetical protein
MLVALAIALAGGIVAYALWRVPGWLGAAHAAAGLVVYAVVGYLWLMTLFIAPRLLELIVLALKRLHLGGGFVLILNFAPPFLAALLTVRLLGRRRGRTAGIE